MIQAVFVSWWICPLLMTLLVGILCPATGAVLITQHRLLQANLISHAVVPGLVLALSLGIDPSLGGAVFACLFGLIIVILLDRSAMLTPGYEDAK